jgi:MFS family permease
VGTLNRIVATAKEMRVSLVVASGIFLAGLDALILSTAIPGIASSLGEDPVRLNSGLHATIYMSFLTRPQRNESPTTSHCP